MKKLYRSPMIEKLMFHYEENVFASGDGKDGRDPSHPSYNACFTHNTSDVSEHNSTPCEGTPK